MKLADSQEMLELSLDSNCYTRMSTHCMCADMLYVIIVFCIPKGKQKKKEQTNKETHDITMT